MSDLQGQMHAAAGHSQYLIEPLYVANLHKDISEHQLDEILRAIGRVAYITIGSMANNTSLQSAFVVYEDAENAARALEILNLTVLNGVRIHVMYKWEKDLYPGIFNHDGRKPLQEQEQQADSQMLAGGNPGLGNGGSHNNPTVQNARNAAIPSKFTAGVLHVPALEFNWVPIDGFTSLPQWLLSIWTYISP